MARRKGGRVNIQEGRKLRGVYKEPQLIPRRKRDVAGSCLEVPERPRLWLTYR
ncbi:hypothetical protein D3C81_2269980 [compost metagenome]